jgi:hypothetical protein
MKLAIDIVQSLLLPKLEKDTSFDANQTNIAFWETFTTAFLDFEKDAKPVYAAIYILGLKDAEKIISKLDTLYISFIKELAEKHVLGISSEAIDYLITSKNSAFEKEVHFFTDLQNAITKVERKRIKTELPITFDKLNFEISDDAISLAITKKEREALKEKMNAWDEELAVSEESPVYSVSAKKETKVISLSWIKYAAAACIVLTAGIMYFKFNSGNNFVQPGDNNVVTAPVKKDTNSKGKITSEIPIEAIADISSVSKTTLVIESGLGFASKEKKIKIVENNQRARMQSIVIAIDRYRQFIEKELTENKVGYGPVVKEIESKIKALENELALLKERDNHYIFDGKSLLLYSSNFAKENVIVLYEDKYYLKRDADFYSLTIAKQQQAYKKVTDVSLVEVLYNLYFE